MGYYTLYNLDAYEHGTRVTEEREEEICAFARECSEITEYMDIIHFDELSYDSMKWYSHDEDILELSKNFPSVIFELSGEGEDRDDNWISYYHNGEMETLHGHIVYDQPQTEFADIVRSIW